MSENRVVLRVENLKKSFGDKEVLKGVSFDMNEGETKVIIGPSGTGKSTLLSCINMLVTPDEGKIWLEKEEVTSAKNINRIRQEIGFVFQDFGLFNHLTALRNVMVGLTKVKKVEKEKA
ncbi:ATP-binding cassette domain-containing protein, partial [Mesotoga sp. TolDC]